MIKQIPRRIKNVEAKEKKGSYGLWRREFCKKYQELLIRARTSAHHSLVETLAASGGTVSCRKGCIHCCFHYVTASLAQGLVIVDYLYRRKDLLRQFVINYQKWHGKGYAVSNTIDHARNQSMALDKPISQLIMETRPLSERYLAMAIPCPFLVGNQCFIYELRPLSCSGHYSITPPDWCASGSLQKPVIHHVSPCDEDLMEMMKLSDPRLLLHELTLPIMVNKLLCEGGESVMAEIVK
jgi:Fe-S-cluster containining protein